jgi:hypothetical protein
MLLGTYLFLLATWMGCLGNPRSSEFVPQPGQNLKMDWVPIVPVDEVDVP